MFRCADLLPSFRAALAACSVVAVCSLAAMQGQSQVDRMESDTVRTEALCRARLGRQIAEMDSVMIREFCDEQIAAELDATVRRLEAEER